MPFRFLPISPLRRFIFVNTSTSPIFFVLLSTYRFSWFFQRPDHARLTTLSTPLPSTCFLRRRLTPPWSSGTPSQPPSTIALLFHLRAWLTLAISQPLTVPLPSPGLDLAGSPSSAGVSPHRDVVQRNSSFTGGMEPRQGRVSLRLSVLDLPHHSSGDPDVLLDPVTEGSWHR